MTKEPKPIPYSFADSSKTVLMVEELEEGDCAGCMFYGADGCVLSERSSFAAKDIIEGLGELECGSKTIIYRPAEEYTITEIAAMIILDREPREW